MPTTVFRPDDPEIERKLELRAADRLAKLSGELPRVRSIRGGMTEDRGAVPDLGARVTREKLGLEANAVGELAQILADAAAQQAKLRWEGPRGSEDE